MWDLINGRLCVAERRGFKVALIINERILPPSVCRVLDFFHGGRCTATLRWLPVNFGTLGTKLTGFMSLKKVGMMDLVKRRWRIISCLPMPIRGAVHQRDSQKSMCLRDSSLIVGA